MYTRTVITSSSLSCTPCVSKALQQTLEVVGRRMPRELRPARLSELSLSLSLVTHAHDLRAFSTARADNPFVFIQFGEAWLNKTQNFNNIAKYCVNLKMYQNIY